MRKQVETCRARYDAAVNAVYALAEHGQMKFSECRAIAPQALRDRLETARATLDAAEAAAIAGVRCRQPPSACRSRSVRTGRQKFALYIVK